MPFLTYLWYSLSSSFQFFHLPSNQTIDTLHKWHLNLYIFSLIQVSLCFQKKDFLHNCGLRMYKNCYSNLGIIYAKARILKVVILSKLDHSQAYHESCIHPRNAF